MKRHIALSCLMLAGCLGGNGSGPTDGASPECPDQPYADLNRHAGELADLLYQVDVAQLLLLKGATDRFETTISDHDSVYTSQEVYDLLTAGRGFARYADSTRASLNQIAAAAESLDTEGEWKPLFEKWRSSIDEALRTGDSLFLATRAHTESLALGFPPPDSSGEAASLECRAIEIFPAAADLDEFAAEASDAEWAAFLPTFLACAEETLTKQWGDHARRLAAIAGRREEPLLGPVGFDRLESVLLATDPTWASLDSWAAGDASLTIRLAADSSSAAALAVLLPATGAARGALYAPFFLTDGLTLSPLPAGSYDLLLFASGCRPDAEQVALPAGENTLLLAGPSRLTAEDCTLSGGEVPLWVYDPASEEHLSNDFTTPCPTEVWTGQSIFQIETEDLEGYALRSDGTFRFVVQCDDQSIEGAGSGTVSLLPLGETTCDLSGPTPETFTFHVRGARTQTTLTITLETDPDSFSVDVHCPGQTTRSFDATALVFPDRQVSFEDLSGGTAEQIFPPGATEDDPFYIRTSILRTF